MININFHYTNPKTINISDLITTMVAHLTPAQSAINESDSLRSVRTQLTEPFEYGSLSIGSINANHASRWARDICLFDRLNSQDDLFALQDTRYVRCPSGQETLYLLVLTRDAEERSNLVVSLSSQSYPNPLADRLALMEEWYLCFNNVGYDKTIASMTSLSRSLRSEGIQVPDFISDPPSQDNFGAFFQREIQTLKSRLSPIVLSSAIGMMRFYEDFFGHPISKAGYVLSSAEASEGDTNFRLMVTKADYNMVTSVPTIPVNEVVTQLMGDGGSETPPTPYTVQ